MIQIYINNQPTLVPQNSSILEACDSIGITIPRFCYHERLNVAGNCRMCLVEIEKAPKPVASCAFPVSRNLKIFTNSPLVQKARENVLEFLLVNHPLDCPICDQGGECDLQDQTLAFGSDRSRFNFKKRGVEDKNCGPLIKTIMTRCIHCTRCVRFLEEITGSQELGTTMRGRETEIGSYLEKNIDSELSGNIVDLCPVGALTSKPYSFVARPWELKKCESVDLTDAVGSNINIFSKESEIVRVLPRRNDSINEDWISDKARFFFDGFKINRILSPLIGYNDNFIPFSYNKVSELLTSKFFSNKKNNNVLVNLGENLDFENLYFFKILAQYTGIDLIYETKSKLSNNILSFHKLNNKIKNINKTDLIITIGINPRFDASMLNVRLKALCSNSNTESFSIGCVGNRTYLNNEIGSSLFTLIQILEGKHDICQSLAKSKSPLILISSHLYEREDYKILSLLFSLLKTYMNIQNPEKFGIGIISTQPNYVGSQFLGIKTFKRFIKSYDFIYNVLINNVSKQVSLNNCHQNHVYSQDIFKTANSLIPFSSYTKDLGTFCNLEGRFQQANLDYINNFFRVGLNNILFLKLSFVKFYELFSNNKNRMLPLGSLLLENEFHLKSTIFKNNFSDTSKIKNSSILPRFNDFYRTDIVTKNSKVLSKCSQMCQKIYSNFNNTILYYA